MTDLKLERCPFCGSKYVNPVEDSDSCFYYGSCADCQKKFTIEIKEDKSDD